MKTVTTICTENYPGYPDPLIMTVDVADDATVDDIEEAVFQLRMNELGEEEEEVIRETLTVHFGWEGDLNWDDLIFDRRT